jgi:hypothetical protein
VQVRLCFVPCGGGPIDYVRDVDVPALPETGDYVIVADHEPGGASGEVATFRVRRKWWSFDMVVVQDQDAAPQQESVRVFVECEFARGPSASENHLANYELHARATGVQVVFDDSMT